ncbi:hypothetical protein SIO70_23505 [Chitinophaga sancti]|uniref:hypothetical protein n=1 Tax=Chitinophaga sancti TaxID=1004 RepID=UPI002A764798|nr:hypothetical protein [Chitinophaga sancti]WPQ61328.1 hypothetical protein SIO70_23505 [Chitinophaga sancti]
MLQLKTDHTFRNRFLFVFLLLTIFNGLKGYATDNRLYDVGLQVQPGSCAQDVPLQASNRQHRALAVHPPKDLSMRTQVTHRSQELSFRAQTTHRPHFDLNPSHFFLHLPISLMEDLPEDLTENQIAFISRAHEPRHKRRFYISATSQQYSFTTRLQQLQLLLAQYVPGNENKTGIYQWHDAFLPAYYKFLFRYTLF